MIIRIEDTLMFEDKIDIAIELEDGRIGYYELYVSEIDEDELDFSDGFSTESHD